MARGLLPTSSVTLLTISITLSINLRYLPATTTKKQLVDASIPFKSIFTSFFEAIETAEKPISCLQPKMNSVTKAQICFSKVKSTIIGFHPSNWRCQSQKPWFLRYGNNLKLKRVLCYTFIRGNKSLSERKTKFIPLYIHTMIPTQKSKKIFRCTL